MKLVRIDVVEVFVPKTVRFAFCPRLLSKNAASIFSIFALCRSYHLLHCSSFLLPLRQIDDTAPGKLKFLSSVPFGTGIGHEQHDLIRFFSFS